MLELNELIELDLEGEEELKEDAGEDERDDDDDESDDDEDERDGRRRSVEGRALALVNRINALALGMMKLRAFKDRQDEVFKILASVSS